MRPDLESLRCFDAAAGHLTFRVAARAVGLSPAAFGERIKRLEDQLGEALFARTTRRVALTRAGERLARHARRILDDAARCREVIREASTPMPYELAIGTRYELGLSWLTPALAPLRARNPERTLHLAFGDSADLLARVRQGLLDCAVTSARLAPRGLTYETLHDEDYVFVGAASTLRRHALRRTEDAAAHVLVDAAPDLPLFRYFLDARREMWAFASLQFLGTISAIRLRLFQGDGVAVLPHYFVAADLRAGRLARILPKMKLQRDAFRLVWRTGHAREPELRRLAAELAASPLR